MGIADAVDPGQALVTHIVAPGDGVEGFVFLDHMERRFRQKQLVARPQLARLARAIKRHQFVNGQVKTLGDGGVALPLLHDDRIALIRFAPRIMGFPP